MLLTKKKSLSRCRNVPDLSKTKNYSQFNTNFLISHAKCSAITDADRTSVIKLRSRKRPYYNGKGSPPITIGAFMEFITTSITQNENDSQNIAKTLNHLRIQTLTQITAKQGGEV